MFQVPSASGGELRFRIFDVPVRVQPWFWAISAMMGLSQDTKAVLIWVAVVFVSILVHELGHIAAFRSFGVPAEVILYSFGGLAVPQRAFHRTTAKGVIISAAGPAAGFTLAAVMLAALSLAGARVYFDTFLYVIPDVSVFWGASNSPYLNFALNNLLYVNIYWGLVNLLPVIPLDGGHIAQALFTQRDPIGGQRLAAILSAAVGAAIACMALYAGRTYLFFLFGFLAVGSIQSLEKGPRRV